MNQTNNNLWTDREDKGQGEGRGLRWGGGGEQGEARRDGVTEWEGGNGVLYYIILYYTILYYSILDYTVLCYEGSVEQGVRERSTSRRQTIFRATTCRDCRDLCTSN